MAAVPGLLPPLPASPRAVELRAGRTDIGGRARGRRRAVGRRAAVVLVLAVVGALLVLVGIEVATPDGSGYAQPLDSRVRRVEHDPPDGVRDRASRRHARLLLTWPALVLLALVAAVGLALRTRRLGRRRTPPAGDAPARRRRDGRSRRAGCGPPRATALPHLPRRAVRPGRLRLPGRPGRGARGDRVDHRARRRARGRARRVPGGGSSPPPPGWWSASPPPRP